MAMNRCPINWEQLADDSSEDMMMMTMTHLGWVSGNLKSTEHLTIHKCFEEAVGSVLAVDDTTKYELGVSPIITMFLDIKTCGRDF